MNFPDRARYLLPCPFPFSILSLSFSLSLSLSFSLSLSLDIFPRAAAQRESFSPSLDTDTECRDRVFSAICRHTWIPFLSSTYVSREQNKSKPRAATVCARKGKKFQEALIGAEERHESPRVRPINARLTSRFARYLRGTASRPRKVRGLAGLIARARWSLELPRSKTEKRREREKESGWRSYRDHFSQSPSLPLARGRLFLVLEKRQRNENLSDSFDRSL